MLQESWKYRFNVIKMSFPFTAVNLIRFSGRYLCRQVLNNFHISSSLLNEVINIKNICKATRFIPIGGNLKLG